MERHFPDFPEHAKDGESEETMWKYVMILLLIPVWLSGCGRDEEVFALNGSEFLGEELTVAQEDTVQDTEASGDTVFVHVCGAVRTPGVVEVAAGSRAQAAVEAAGGFLEEADTVYVNLADILEDGEQLYIPTVEEAEELRESQLVSQNGKINLNSADRSQLCTLPGIGESRADDIIAYRTQHGGFSDAEEIMLVPGIKTSVYEKIKDRIFAE